MRLLIALPIVLFAACVKAPHEGPLAYFEFDKAPDYVWRPYSNAGEDDPRSAYWAGYQDWLCPRAIDDRGNWRAGESSTVQRQVACDGFQRKQRHEMETTRNQRFQAGVAEVELGMNEAEVTALLGRPAEIDQSDDPSDTEARWIYRDASRKKTVLLLRFRDGRLESLGN